MTSATTSHNPKPEEPNPMATATAPATALNVVSDETITADELRAEAEKARQAADQLAARISDLLPRWDDDAEAILTWSPEERAAVVELLDNPPRTLDEIPDEASRVVGAGWAVDLFVAAIRRKLDNALRRDSVVRRAEHRLAREKASLRSIDDMLKSLKEDRKEQEAIVAGAVHTLQSAVRDQAAGQNSLPMDDGDDDETAASAASDASGADEHDPADPASSTAISDLDLSSSMTEKLREASLTTVADVIAWIGAEPRKRIAGVGESAIDKISDALIEWRKANPVEAD